MDRSGEIVAAWGDPQVPILPRSALKPVQAAALVRLGLELPPPLLALAASSHSGEAFHLEGVTRILADSGLDAGRLQTPPDQAYDPVERDRRIEAGLGAEPLVMNCSGKHAAMLATCVGRGWSLADYLDPDHPVQRAIRAEVEAGTGEEVLASAVDGCGAPVYAIRLAGLARCFSAAVTAEPGSPSRRVADAMRAHPEWVGGTRRDVTALMRGVAGLLAKDGAEAVYAAALADGTGVAVKVVDGADRSRAVVMSAVLRGLGIDAPVLDQQAAVVVTGGGRPVGAVRAAGALAAIGPG